MSRIIKTKKTKNSKALMKILFDRDVITFWAYDDSVYFQLNENGNINKISKNHFRVLSDFCEKEFNEEIK